MPQVSIITPAYNCKETIKETYESIKAQTFPAWEWVICEDHSRDDSLDYIQKMIEGDDRVVLLRTKKNSGAAIARNVAIEKARGRYIAFLDSDDLWKEEKLEKQIKFMQENNYAFTYTNYDLRYENGQCKQYRPKKNQIDYKTLLRRNDIGCLTAIYDSQKLGKVFMPLDCEKREDHGAWLDITRNGVIAYKLDEFLAIYRMGGKSVSANKMKMVKFQYRLYRKHEKFGVIKSLWYVMLMSFHKVFRKY
ncbi:MAG: glycosyltransferase family 2 protein [Bacilli bacterium]|jgi:teichuronic acid biosynthesis glycosyltransferase TuaG